MLWNECYIIAVVTSRGPIDRQLEVYLQIMSNFLTIQTLQISLFTLTASQTAPILVSGLSKDKQDC